MDSDIQALLDLSPDNEKTLKRLQALLAEDSLPKIAVYGKYNHGKSTLLNALVGDDVFKAADKRETTKNKKIESDGVIWIDTPGLDADVDQQDDNVARQALQDADFLLLVHSVKAGELDKSEKHVISALLQQDYSYKDKCLLVLTQIDQVSDEELATVTAKVSEQFPNLKKVQVSAVRAQKGVENNKPGLVMASKLQDLQQCLEEMTGELESLRIKEGRRLILKLRSQFRDELNDAKKVIYTAKSEKQSFIDAFVTDFTSAREAYDQAAKDLELR